MGVSLACAASAQVGPAPSAAPPPPPASTPRPAPVPESAPASAFAAAQPSAAVAGDPGWLGVALVAPGLGEPGAIVSSVLRGSPAALSGLEVGDLVLALNGEPVETPEQFSSRIGEAGAGARARLVLRRGGDMRLLAVTLGKNPGPEGRLRLGFLNAPAPELEGVEVAQGELGPTLQALRGRVVVLEFWAAWCPACRALLPTLNEWHERFAPERAQIVSIVMDSAEQAADEAAQLGMRYPVLADPAGRTVQRYQAFSLPTLFVIDRAGIVREVAVGFDPARLSAIVASIERLSQQPS